MFTKEGQGGLDRQVSILANKEGFQTLMKLFNIGILIRQALFNIIRNPIIKKHNKRPIMKWSHLHTIIECDVIHNKLQ